MWRKRRLIRCQTEIISPIVLFVSIPVGGRTTRAMKQTRRNLLKLLSIRWCGWINLIFLSIRWICPKLFSLCVAKLINPTTNAARKSRFISQNSGKNNSSCSQNPRIDSWTRVGGLERGGKIFKQVIFHQIFYLKISNKSLKQIQPQNLSSFNNFTTLIPSCGF